MRLLTLFMVPGSALAVEYAEILSVETLVAEADQVAQGTVAKTESEWGKDGLIYTRVDLDVANSLMHWRDSHVSFLVPGGRMDDLELTIPGSPQFAVGDDVLVFLTGERLLGLGQGSFSMEDGSAVRSLGNKVDKTSLQSVFGDPVGARGCTREHLLGAYEEGWSLRRSAMLRMGHNDVRSMEVTLIQGVEYSIQLCADGLGKGSWVGVFDANEQMLVESDLRSDSGTLEVVVPETGSYWISAYNDAVVDGWTTSLDVSIRFR